MSRRTGRSKNLRGAPLLEQALRDRIRRGEIAVGAILPTERELQQEFGVSRSTVRRALAALVASGWAEASPNRGVIAQHGPIEARTRNVAFIDHGDGMQRDLFFAIGRRLQLVGYHLVHVDSRIHGVEGSVEYAAEHGFAGALVWSKVGYPDASRIQPLMADLPIVPRRFKLVVRDERSQKQMSAVSSLLRRDDVDAGTNFFDAGGTSVAAVRLAHRVLVLRGRSGSVRRIADRLLATKGVQHGRLTLTAPE